MQYFKDAEDNTYLINSADEFGSLPAGIVPITVAEFHAILKLREVIGPEVPQSVTRFQALAALHLAGHLPAVQAIMAAPETPVLAKLAWDNALSFERTSPTLASLAGAIGLTSQDLDALFTEAARLSA